ncbi:sensor histidine kinase [Tateyamaria omphalii]|uniref:sensor histidine kinase n=1 Tax=Tateyamaria omphalii TaxID=299262 RepID=UPI001C99048F|nr:sensor histidine kinase [Tateyamaria omphalii]MBY5933319.1 sensor histidine kinase [Tateyamaria omphalii]
MRGRATSLRRRLTWTLIGGAAVLAVLFYLVVRTYAQQIAQQGQDRILEASLTSLMDAAVVREGQVEVDVPYAAFAMLDTAADDRVFYAIHQGAELLTGYDGLVDGPFVAMARPAFDTVGFAGIDVRLAQLTRVLPASPAPVMLTVSVAQTRDSLAGTLWAISVNAALFGGAFFVLAAGMALWTSRSTMRPLSQMAEAVARRGPRDLRPVVRAVPTELSPLVTSLNSLMTRLSASLTQSETFIAEAAHRVRTPLATVRTHAEATLMRVDRDENRAALRSMIRAIDESSRAAGQLLDHAMVTFRGDQMERSAVDLVGICRELVDRLTPVAEMKDLELVLRADGPVVVQADPILIQNAVRNLIDNALKYSPPEGAVRIEVQADPVAVIVCDEGAGFPEAQIAELSQRFQRGANAGDTVGSGLGLTIAQDVAEAHGGRLELVNVDRGGACATLYL